MSLRICYLMPRLLPTPSGAIVGGSAMNCVSLALELKRRGADVELLAPISQEGLKCLANSPLAEIVVPLPKRGKGLIGKGFGSLCSLRNGLKKRMRAAAFDVVHSHSGTYPYAVVPLAADRRSCVRLHSLYCPLGAKGGVYSNWWEKVAAARLAFEKLDRVVAVTENVRQSLENAHVRPERIELVPMCVDSRRFHPRPPREPAVYFPHEGRGTRVLFVGNASKEKGLLELLRAVKLLTNKGTPLFLVAALENQCGIREYAAGRDQAEAFVRQSGLENQVRFIGIVDSIEDLYAECDLVVIPWSTSRGPSDYPMVVLEAMAMGKCVVSTPVGGCPDLLAGGRAGFLADGFAAADIAAAIGSAAESPNDRTRVERTATERARDFSLANSASHLLALYERLLKGKTSYAKCCV